MNLILNNFDFIEIFLFFDYLNKINYYNICNLIDCFYFNLIINYSIFIVNFFYEIYD